MITFYKLRHATDATKECYVGSTNNFPRRKISHKSDCNNSNSDKHNIKVYRYIRANDGYDNWMFDILEQTLSMSKRDKYIREGELKNQHNATLNGQEPGALLQLVEQSITDDGIGSTKMSIKKKPDNTISSITPSIKKEYAKTRNRDRAKFIFAISVVSYNVEKIIISDTSDQRNVKDSPNNGFNQ